MSRICRQAYTGESRRYAAWRHVARMLTVKPMAYFWWSSISGVLLCIALFAGLSHANGAMAQGPHIRRVSQTRQTSVYLVESVPYDANCQQETGATLASTLPDVEIRYAEVRAFCFDDGNGNGRLTFSVTGKCRLVLWQGETIESGCQFAPVIVAR